MTRGRLPLSVLVDRMGGDGPRDERFVRRLSAWFSDHAPHLHLTPLDSLGLADVVLTFRMKGTVTLVATGHQANHPGEVTVRFGEQDFPHVDVIVDREPRRVPYEVCTLDYSVQDRPLELICPVTVGGRPLPAGQRGRAVVHTTVGAAAHLRIVLDALPDQPVNVALDAVRWLDEVSDLQTTDRASSSQARRVRP